MNASRTNAVLLLLLLVLLLLVAVGGCRHGVPAEHVTLFERAPLEQPIPPSELDRAVTDLAVATLAGTAEQRASALARIETLHDEAAMQQARREGHPEMRGLVPLAVDLVNSTLDDPQAYRRASKELLRSHSMHIDPALEARLTQSIADDPLTLAGERTRDHWESLFASTFNTVAEPLGNSLVFGLAIAPFNLATSIMNYAVDLYTRPELSLQERQALAQRKRFVAQYPDSPDAPKVREKIAKAEAELEEMQSESFEKGAKESLAHGSYNAALQQSERALDLDSEDGEAAEIYVKAHGDELQMQDLRRISEEFTVDEPEEFRPGAYDAALLKSLLEGMLSSSSAYEALDTFSAESFDDPAKRQHVLARLEQLSTRARRLQNADPTGPMADEAEFVQALAQRDLGFEVESWGRLQELARRDPLESNMARHAQALLEDPWQNTYGNYLRQQHRATEQAALTRVFGRFANGPRDRGLPTPVAWLVSLPSLVQTVVTAPLRMVFGNWDPIGVDYDRVAAAAAYRHLRRNPYGRHSREVASWLYGYETERENWVAALAVVDLQDEIDATDRVVLMEKAAKERLENANLADRRDVRKAMLRGLVETYPDSDAGYQAGDDLRLLVDDASPQRIRMTRGFLAENPEIALDDGLGVNPALLDEDVSNGEIHPEGVTFLGGLVIEFALVAETGDEDDPPVKRREHVSSERLARAVAKLDETVTLVEQVDDGDAVYPDAFRDHYLEQARLGLTEVPDVRASAESNYVYESMREQYGIVRGRDSLLPFDLVFQGSISDMTLGAFPRWRQPPETPDAFLYK